MCAVIGQYLCYSFLKSNFIISTFRALGSNSI